MTATLPNPLDEAYRGVWANDLNDFLRVEHNDDGTHASPVLKATIFGAKGEILSGGGSGIAVTTAPTADGQIPVSDSTKPGGIGWSAAPGGGLLVTIFNAKGDLIGGTGPDAAGIVSAGPDGSVPVWDSTQPVGIKAGGRPIQHRLTANITAGDLDFDVEDTTGLAVGIFVGVDVLTGQHEVRRITAIDTSTNNVTVAAAFKYGHATDDDVWPVYGAVPLAWYGVSFGLPAVDSYRQLQHSFLDANIHKLPLEGYGGDGGLTTYHSRPLWMGDKMRLWRTRVTCTSPYSIPDNRDTTFAGMYMQFDWCLAGQIGTATFSASADTVTLSTSAGGNGAWVAFYARDGATLPGGIEEGKTYFVVNGASLTTQLTHDAHSGVPVDITSNGSGEIVFFSLGGARLGLFDCNFIGSGGAQALGGLAALMLQPSYCDHTRIESYSGAALAVGGQQGCFRNVELVDSKIGCLHALQFSYFSDFNVEGCDILWRFWDHTLEETSTVTMSPVSKGCDMRGVHFESPGTGLQDIQTIIGGGGVTGGTFPLTYTGQTASGIPWNASAATIQTALEALSTVGTGNVVCTDEAGGLAAGGRVRMKFQGALAEKRLNSVTISSASLVGGTYSINRINPVNNAIVDMLAGAGIDCSQPWMGTLAGKPDGTRPDFWNYSGTAESKVSFWIRNALSSSAVGGGTPANFVVNAASGEVITWNEFGGYGDYRFISVDDGATDSKCWTMTGYKGRRISFRCGGTASDTKAMLTLTGGSSAQNQPLYRSKRGYTTQTGNHYEACDENDGVLWAVLPGGAMEMLEQTAPAAPAANRARIYTEDNGAGKTRLMARFPTGAAQQVAIEP